MQLSYCQKVNRTLQHFYALKTPACITMEIYEIISTGALTVRDDCNLSWSLKDSSYWTLGQISKSNILNIFFYMMFMQNRQERIKPPTRDGSRFPWTPSNWYVQAILTVFVPPIYIKILCYIFILNIYE